MNDIEIRLNFHRKELRQEHLQKNTLVIDELGLNHGKCRADIAVVNGHLIGYEIKSDQDSLQRLKEQIKSYNAIFDKVSVIVGNRHVNSIQKYIPDWWGVIVSTKSSTEVVNFELIRKAKINKDIDPISIAQLLWRNEAEEILYREKIPSKILRQTRDVLYEYLVEIFSIKQLQKIVRDYLKKRKNWRCPASPSQCDDLSQPVAM